MKLLLDTHIWLWDLLTPKKLSLPVRKQIQNPRNELWLSPISIWEAMLLHEQKRVVLGGDPAAWIEEALQAMPVIEAPLTKEVAIASRRIVLAHDDPADRFLVATAKVYGLTLVTGDEVLARCEAAPLLVN